MNKNIGTVDKGLRVVVGLAILVFGVVNQSWLGSIGLIPLGTAIIGWCPLYSLLKVNTCSKECKTK